MLGGVEDEGKPQPCREDILLVVEIEALRPAHRGRVQVVVQRYRVVEHDDVAKVVLASQDRPVAPGRRTDNRRGGVLRILAVVDYVVEVEDHLLAWAAGSDLATVSGSGAEDEQEDQEGDWKSNLGSFCFHSFVLEKQLTDSTSYEAIRVPLYISDPSNLRALIRQKS